MNKPRFTGLKKHAQGHLAKTKFIHLSLSLYSFHCAWVLLLMPVTISRIGPTIFITPKTFSVSSHLLKVPLKLGILCHSSFFLPNFIRNFHMAIIETTNQSAGSCAKSVLKELIILLTGKKNQNNKNKNKSKTKTNLVNTPENTEVSQKRLNPPSSSVKYLASY